MTDQVGATWRKKAPCTPSHYLLKDSFNMNKSYPFLIASTEDIFPSLDYTKTDTKSWTITQGDAKQGYLLPRITTEGYNCASIQC